MVDDFRGRTKVVLALLSYMHTRARTILILWRTNVPTIRVQTMVDAVRLSLCAIVRESARHLGVALTSIRFWVDGLTGVEF